jgi:hypothetical protein
MSAFEHLHLSAQGFLFDHHSGISYSTNTVGAFILNHLIQGEDQETVLSQLKDLYDVDVDRVTHDLSEFMLLLKQHSLFSQGESA